MKAILFLLLFVSPALAQPSTSHMWTWGYPAWGSTNVQSYGGSGAIDCTAWVPTLGITNATKIAWFVTAGSGGELCSTAIFNSGGTKIFDSGAIACSAAGAKIATGLSAQSFLAGVKYYVCTCTSAASNNYLTSNNGGDQATLSQALSVPQRTRAVNTCTAGVMPGTSGGFNSAAIQPIIVLFATNSP